ncbi:MAG: hypothetical protein AAF840_12935, partial [Bacteroidota bacterium]
EVLHYDTRDTMMSYGWGNDYKPATGLQYSFCSGSAGTFFAHLVIEKSNPIGYIIIVNTDSPDIRTMIMNLRAEMEVQYSEHEVFAKKR